MIVRACDGPLIVEHESLRLEYFALSSGAMVCSICVHGYVEPIGFITYMPLEATDAKRVFHVLNSYIHPRFRRQGIRTWVNEQWFEQHPNCVITTAAMTDDGEHFMSSFGYKWSNQTNLYYTNQSLHKKATAKRLLAGK